METSALDSSNVAAAFQTVVKEIYNILSRKVMMSHESKKQDAPLEGKTVVLQAEENQQPETEAKPAAGCCSS
ncbi:hypothetical protein V6N12_003650 [Hibiscus sabdariffa]